MKTKLVLFLLLNLIVFAQLIASEKSEKSNLSEYTGKYIFPAGAVVYDAVITLLRDTLNASVSLGSVSLVPVEKDSFGIPQYGGTVIFLRDKQDQVTGLKVFFPMGGIEELEATKDLKIAENKN